MKYVSPYYDDTCYYSSMEHANMKIVYVRKTLYTEAYNGGPIRYAVWLNRTRKTWCRGISEYASKIEAMNALDRYLLADGYEILNEERWQKLSLLL